MKKGQASVSIRLPYPTGKHADDASDWSNDALHTSRIINSSDHIVTLMHNIDTTTYYIYIRWEGDAQFKEVKAHTYQLITDADALSFEVEYSPVRRSIDSAIEAFRFDQAQKTTQKFWHKFWTETLLISANVQTHVPRNWNVVWYCHNTSLASIVPTICLHRRQDLLTTRGLGVLI